MSSPRRKKDQVAALYTYAWPLFFWWTKVSRRWRRIHGRNRGALRNVVTASKFDSHFSVASGVVAPVFTGLQQRPRNSGLEEFLLPATSPRTFTYTARCILVLTFPCSPLPATDPLATAGGNNVRDSRESRESSCKFSATFARRDTPRKNKPRSDCILFYRDSEFFFAQGTLRHVCIIGISMRYQYIRNYYILSIIYFNIENNMGRSTIKDPPW
jgi:hypothetical protein